MKPVSESVDAIMRGKRILFAGFVARMEDTRLPKWIKSLMYATGGQEFSRLSPS